MQTDGQVDELSRDLISSKPDLLNHIPTSQVTNYSQTTWWQFYPRLSEASGCDIGKEFNHRQLTLIDEGLEARDADRQTPQQKLKNLL